MRRFVVIQIVAACAIAIAASAADPPSAASRPNIVIFVADDLGLTLGCYGDQVAKTPHMDRLAANGVRFTHAFCTTASCSPSRSVILSGRHCHANGQYGLEHAAHHFRSFENLKTLPVLLGEAGYRTARSGKFHVGPEDIYRFQTALPGNARNGVQMANQCRPWLAEKADVPFFLYFCVADPHRGGAALDRGINRFGNEQARGGVDERKFAASEVPVPSFLPDTDSCRAELAEYYQSVSRADQGLGRLIEVLEEAGHKDDTLLMVLSDNGMPFPGAKTTLYDAGMRLPLIVRAPGQKPSGVVNNAMISWVDLAPTVLDFAQVKNPPVMHGRSFKEILEESDPSGWDEVFASHCFHEVTMYYPMRVLRTRRHKLIHNLASALEYPSAHDLWTSATWQETIKAKAEFYGRRRIQDFLHRPEWELYDIEVDPDETANLAGKSELAASQQQMRQKLRNFQVMTEDPWIIKFQHE
ncbi:MAG: sulfatase family protein [Verrucomicrobiales bacterium]